MLRKPASDAASLTPIQRLIERLSRLPGIGRRSAERIAFYLLKQPASEAQALAAVLQEVRASTVPCSICHNLTNTDPCAICSDPQRDKATVLVVEQPTDVATLEATGQFRGLYHVLMGRLSPLDGIGPSELTIASLLQRVRQHAVREVILGTNPTLEGDATALYLNQELAKLGVKVSKLARGLPTGASLDVVSKAVLADALEGRQGMTSGH